MNTIEFEKKYLSNLNPQQLEAVKAVDGAVLVLAVPGSGKTTVLINRLGYMIFCKNINPDNILCLTYTVAATKDMGNRFAKIFGEENRGLVEFRTINGICAKIILEYCRKNNSKGFDLISDEKENRLISNIVKNTLNIFPGENTVKAVKTSITYIKNMLLEDNEIDLLGEVTDFDEFGGEKLLSIYNNYCQYLKDHHLQDYDDQMVYAYKILRKDNELLNNYRAKYRYICVDESQDTSKIQHLIIRLLAGENGNIFMVGDEDQSIYGFRAAYPEALLEFDKTYNNTKKIVMNINYRSNANIVTVADEFIQKNKDRYPKHMVANRAAGSDLKFIDILRYNQYKYLLKVAENCKDETAVLYRENAYALPIVNLLDKNNIRFKIKKPIFLFLLIVPLLIQ